MSAAVMGDLEIRVNFNNPMKTYHPGELVHCKVQIIVRNHPHKVGRCVTGFIFGYCETNMKKWAFFKKPTGCCNMGKADFYGKEEILNESKDIIGHKYGPEFDLKPATHSYNMEFRLPPALPSSFENKHCFIRYGIRIKFDSSIVIKHEELFKIVSPLHLNQIPGVSEPYKMELIRNVGMWYCCPRTVRLVMSLPRTGYAPSDVIPVVVECESHVDIFDVTMRLIHVLTFRFTHPREDKLIFEQLISERKTPADVKRGEKKIFGGKLQIPNDYQVPVMSGSNLIKSQYFVQIWARTVSVTGTKIEMKHEITMGTTTLGTEIVPATSYSPRIVIQ